MYVCHGQMSTVIESGIERSHFTGHRVGHIVTSSVQSCRSADIAGIVVKELTATAITCLTVI